jgi:hypothetical protein
LTEEADIPKPPKKFLLADIDHASILQINATVIAGLLILLTIGGSILPSTTLDINPPLSTNQTEIMRYQAEKALSQASSSVEIWGKLAITFSVAFPFILSSILALFSNLKGASVGLMVAGFMWLMVVLVIVVVSNEYHALSQLRDASEKFNHIPH